MEYLEMRGEVKLKADANKTIVQNVLGKLQGTEFYDQGYMDISIEDCILSISAEGTISDSFALRAQLTQLQGQLTETSMIGVSSVRWEILVVLKHWEPLTANRLGIVHPAFAQ